MNALLWAWHIGVLYFSWPLLRHWWGGAVVLGRRIERKRWLVALSVGMPPVAAVWLLPCAIAHRADLRRQERLRPSEWDRQHEADVAFWREQVATGDLVSAWVGIELLAMWHVPVVEPSRPAADVVPLITTGPGDVRPLPGAHAYSRECGCRNCHRARAMAPPWLFDGEPEVPPQVPGRQVDYPH